MKIGDKLICIHNLYVSSTNEILYREKSIYNIINIDMFGVDSVYTIDSKENSNKTSVFNYMFHDNIKSFTTARYIKDYFIPLKQYRKLKLKKLKKINESR